MGGDCIIQKETIINSNIPRSLARSPFPTQKVTFLLARFAAFFARPVGSGGKTMKYPVVIHKDANSDYGVAFPDLPGCYSAGETIEEALANAREAAECHIEGILRDFEPVPGAMRLEEHKHHPDFKDAIWAIVDVDLSKLSLKSKRINITMPERLLASVDSYAQKHGKSRSGLLAEAVTEYMASQP